MTIDWTKPVRYKLWPNHKVRVLCTDAGETYPVVVLLGDQLVRAAMEQFENITEPRLVWINVYPDFSYSYTSREVSDRVAADNRTHVLRVNLDTGETVKEPA